MHAWYAPGSSVVGNVDIPTQRKEAATHPHNPEYQKKSQNQEQKKKTEKDHKKEQKYPIIITRRIEWRNSI